MANPPMIFHSRNSGYDVLFIESGSDATQDTSFYQNSSNGDGSVTSDSTTSKTGPRSMKFDSGTGSSAASLRLYVPTFDTCSTRGRLSFYIRFTNFPIDDSQDRPNGIFLSFFNSVHYALSIDDGGVLSLSYYSGITPYQYSRLVKGSTLSTGVWYRFCIAWRFTADSFDDVRVYLNGSLDMSANRTPLTGVGTITAFSFGWPSDFVGSSKVFNLDDIYLDNNDSLTDPGDIRVTNKRPASNNVNNFPVAVGNNPASRWTNVNEQPISTTNGWLENVGAATVNENYGIEAANTGDVDVSGYSGIYPNALPSSGVSTKWSGGLYLYDCGVHLALNNDTTKIVDYKPWAYLATSVGIVNSLNQVYFYSNGSAIALNSTGNNQPSSSNAGGALNTSPKIFFQYFDTGGVIKPFRFYSRDPGYQVVFMEPGTDATQDLKFYEVSTQGTGIVSSDSTTSKTGPRSIKFSASNGSNDFAILTAHFPDGPAAIQGPGMRVSFYINFSNFPHINYGIYSRIFSFDTANSDFILTVDSSGVLRLLAYDGVFPNNYSQLGGNGITFSTGTWYRICYTHRILGKGINDFRVYVDGVLYISVKNFGGFGPDGNNTAFPQLIDRINLGYINGSGIGSAAVMYIDDIYVDNSDILSDTGNIRITHKRPASNNTNNFPVAVGANPSNRWTNVNEQPLSIVNGWLENGGIAANVKENYGIETASTGDMDISGYSGIYPNALPAAGVLSNYAGGLYLYECGVLIAINDTNSSIVDYKSWAYLATSISAVDSENLVYLYSNGSGVSLNGLNGPNGFVQQPRSPDGNTLTTTPHIFFKYYDTGNVLKPMRFYSRT